ncbi:MAG: hypothetical protein AAGD96_16045 [Chloroflexota bacterium]
MQTKLSSSIYVESPASKEQNAYAISASILTRQGSELHIAALSQKKPGDYTPIDTPRKTLLSFVNNLQSGSDSRIDQLIQRAVGLVHISTGGYIKRHGGAPCGLVAAILNGEQLFTLQVGSGAILLHYGNKLSLLTNPKLIKAPPDSVWLGEPVEFPINNTNFRQGRLEVGSSVMICQPQFLRGIQHKRTAFQDAVTAFMETSDNMAEDIAHWSKSNQINSDLTMAVHSFVEDSGRVEFISSMSSESTLNLLDDFEPSDEPPLDSLGNQELNSHGENGSVPTDPKSTGVLEQVIEAVQEKAELNGKGGSENTDSDTIRTAALPLEAIAPIVPNGNGATKTIEIEKEDELEADLTSISEEAELSVQPVIEAETELDESVDRNSKFYRILMTSVVGLFFALIAMGGAIVLQQTVFSPSQQGNETSNPQPVAVVEASDSNGALGSSENLENTVGSWSQGASAERDLLGIDEELGARGLIHVTINPNGGTDPNQTKGQDVYAWAGSEISFENVSANASFEVAEGSTLFLDSTKSTIRPSLTKLFGVVESSSGCMTVKYGAIDEPLKLTCYSGTCRWLGPLSRTYDIPPGQRLTLASNTQAADPATFDPVNFDETMVFARTLAGTANGKDITSQCLEPYLAEEKQLTSEETAAVVASMSGNFSQEIGYWSLGNTGFRILVDRGDTVNARGMIRLALDVEQADNSNNQEHNIYAWAGSELHFDPKLNQDQVEIREGSTVFLDSTDSTIRPFLAGLFGTAESTDGCMSITYDTKDQPLVLSCFSGTCKWDGALNRSYSIPAGQRLAIEPNPRAEEPAIFEPIYRTETLVFARTLGSTDEGKAVSSICVDPYLPENALTIETNETEDEEEVIEEEDSDEINLEGTENEESEATATIVPLETPSSESENTSDELTSDDDLVIPEEPADNSSDA